jgi:hypothetical protein
MELQMHRTKRILMAALAVAFLALSQARAAAPNDKHKETAEPKKEKGELKEEPIEPEKLPKPVLKAIKRKFPEAKLLGAARQTEEDLISYEILIKHKGHEMYVRCEPDGKIVEVDREISEKELPKPVTEAVKKKYPKFSITTVGEVTEDDNVSYDILLKHGKKSIRVIFDPKGKLLEEEHADEKR